MSKSKDKFYNIAPILEYKTPYNMIIGERSNGKTYSALEIILKKWCEKGEQGAYIRRWKEDYRGKRGTQLFAGHVEQNLISKLTDGEWTGVKYYSGKWFLSKRDDELDKEITQEEPFCFAFALSDMEHDKSTAYPLVTTIVFDEFITRQYYLPDEFVTFMNVLSTIIRHRNNVTIFMLGNTVNKYCPYFKEMGLRHVQEMQQGKIDVYSYGESELRVAVEYCDSPNKDGKKSDLYFAFDNPSLSMITGGAWEIDIYPHNPRHYTPKDILFIFFINFNDTLLQGEIIKLEDCHYMYFHEKTTPIKDEDHDIIFSELYDPRPNHFRNIRKGSSKLEQKLSWYFRNDKVFYQDNETGEVIRNYLQYCATDSGVSRR
jgi:hypothetical protein